MLTLLPNMLDDLFVLAFSLPTAIDMQLSVTIWQPTHGGRVSFGHSRLGLDLQALPDATSG
ncbi:MAG: hypothetical protein ABJB17_11200 [Burkholderiales bacterium]